LNLFLLNSLDCALLNPIKQSGKWAPTTKLVIKIVTIASFINTATYIAYWHGILGK